MANYTLVDVESSVYTSTVEEVERELAHWRARDKGHDFGIQIAIEELEEILLEVRTRRSEDQASSASSPLNEKLKKGAEKDAFEMPEYSLFSPTTSPDSRAEDIQRELDYWRGQDQSSLNIRQVIECLESWLIASGTMASSELTKWIDQSERIQSLIDQKTQSAALWIHGITLLVNWDQLPGVVYRSREGKNLEAAFIKIASGQWASCNPLQLWAEGIPMSLQEFTEGFGGAAFPLPNPEDFDLSNLMPIDDDDDHWSSMRFR